MGKKIAGILRGELFRVLCIAWNLSCSYASADSKYYL